MALTHVLVVLVACGVVGVFSQSTCNCVTSCNNVRPGKYVSCNNTCGFARCFYPPFLRQGSCSAGRNFDDSTAKCSTTTTTCPQAVPCQNGGTCVPLRLSYFCACPPTATGNLCQTVQGLCVKNPCVNGATCVDTTVKGKASFTCNCPSNLAGCVNYANPCDSSPCANGGECYAAGTDFTCSCTNGWGGVTCRDAITACSGSPCSNGGTCRVSTNADGFTCTCTADYRGSTCDDLVDGCSNPSNPCQNGGTCFSNLSVFSCTCAPGFTGNTCQTTTQACSSSPCQNGGTCTGTSTTFTCSCLPGFTGNQCQSQAAVCTSNPCGTGKQCCTQPSGYTCQ